MLEVQNEDHSARNIDTLYLYWERQSDPDTFRPVDIQGYGDSFYLDVVQANEAANKIVLRVMIPKGHRLVSTEKLDQGTYYLKIAIWADGAYIKPTWFRVKWENGSAPLMERI